MNVESVSASSSILTRLRTETRAQHDAIEAALVELTSDGLDRDAYRRTLERFYGFYRPLEMGLWAVGGWGQRDLDVTQRRKTPLLDADLRTLGLANPEDLPVCTELPPHATVAAAFGCLYVLEGATLGGQVISKLLRKSLGVSIENGGRFFHGYGDRSGPMWHAFRASIMTFADTVAIQDEVVAAAKDTFLKMHCWITPQGDNR